MPDMTDAQREEYAATLILEHATEIEHLSIHEMAEQFSPTGECTDADCTAIAALISEATLTIEFPSVQRQYGESV